MILENFDDTNVVEKCIGTNNCIMDISVKIIPKA